MPGRTEQGRPSEEDLRIRTEAGEPKERIDDVQESQRRAIISNGLRNEADELDLSTAATKEESENPPEFEPAYRPLQRKIQVEAQESTSKSLRSRAKQVEDTGRPVPGSYKYE